MQQGTFLYLHHLLQHVTNIHEELRRFAHSHIDLTNLPNVASFLASSASSSLAIAPHGAHGSSHHVNPMHALTSLPMHPRVQGQPLLHRIWSQLQQSQSHPSSGRYLELRRFFDQVYLVQLPLYSMLMSLFARCEQISSFDREVLALGVENWILWLQPWKYVRGFLPGKFLVKKSYFVMKSFVLLLKK